MSKLFLDTNVLIYSVDKDSPDKRDDALTLLKQIGHSGSTVLSTQVLQEFYSAATGKLHIPSEEARMLLVKFTVFEVVQVTTCLLYTSPSPRDDCPSRMPSSA